MLRSNNGEIWDLSSMIGLGACDYFTISFSAPLSDGIPYFLPTIEATVRNVSFIGMVNAVVTSITGKEIVGGVDGIHDNSG